MKVSFRSRESGIGNKLVTHYLASLGIYSRRQDGYRHQSFWTYNIIGFSLLSSVFCLLSSVFCLLSSVFCLLSSIFCLLSSVFCLLSSVFYLLSSIFCLLSSVFYLLSSVFYLLSSVFYLLLIEKLVYHCYLSEANRLNNSHTTLAASFAQCKASPPLLQCLSAANKAPGGYLANS